MFYFIGGLYIVYHRAVWCGSILSASSWPRGMAQSHRRGEKESGSRLQSQLWSFSSSIYILFSGFKDSDVERCSRGGHCESHFCPVTTCFSTVHPRHSHRSFSRSDSTWSVSIIGTSITASKCIIKFILYF